MATVTLVPQKSAYISEWYPHQNFGPSMALFAGQYQQVGDSYRSLLQYDLSQFTSTTTINSAVLQLEMYRNEVESEGIMVEIHRVLGKWEENYVVWHNAPLYFHGIDGEINIRPATSYGKQLMDITGLVSDWCSGCTPNNGLIILGNEASNNLVGFRGQGFNDSRVWPRLVVNFLTGLVTSYTPEQLVVPHHPIPVTASTPIPLGPRERITFLVQNDSHSTEVRVRLQVGHSSDPKAVFYNAGSWISLKDKGGTGEAIAFSSSDAAEYARVLVIGSGGEKVTVYPRSKEL